MRVKAAKGDGEWWLIDEGYNKGVIVEERYFLNCIAMSWENNKN